MHPSDLSAYVTLSDPQLHPDGTTVAFVVSRMNLDDDRYDTRIWLWDGDRVRPFTHGPSDGRPRWSPDGSRLAFLRGGSADEPPQVAVMDAGGGEASVLTSFDLGVSEAEWSPDGSRFAVVGRGWTAEWADLDDEERARRPRRITDVGYRYDDQGWIHDRTSHVYLVAADGSGEPEALTDGTAKHGGVAWRPDGDAVAFISARHDRAWFDSGDQVWEVPVAGGEPTALTGVGMWATVSYDPKGVAHVTGLDDPRAYPDVSRLHRVEGGSLVPLAADLDRSVGAPAPTVSPSGPQWLGDGRARVVIEDRGSLRVIDIAPDGSWTDVLDGQRLITGLTTRSDGSAFVFVSTSTTNPGELHWWEDGEERVLSDFNREFEATSIPPEHFVVEHDGGEIDAWVVLPPGDQSVPLLLNIHGGPATQYGFGFFDEFQVYAAAGFGVVACNPRGSSGRGRDFVRTPVGRWIEDRPPDLEDILAVVDAALDRFDRLDASRMGIMGGSYGGLMTAWILTVDDRWKSAVPERGLYSFTSFAGTSDIGYSFGMMYLGDWSTEDWSDLWAASPLRRAHRITTPCLIIHSEADYRCPIEQAEQLFAALVDRGVEAEFLRFPASSHELSRSGKPRYRQERFEAIVRWHADHLDVTT